VFSLSSEVGAGSMILLKGAHSEPRRRPCANAGRSTAGRDLSMWV
jgi:hypothetical protein